MVEEQVDVEIVLTHLHMILTSDESEALAELEEELLPLAQRAGLQLAVVKGFFQGEEAEEIRVLKRLLGKIGLRGW